MDSKESVKFSFAQKSSEPKKRIKKTYGVQERADSPRRELVVGVRNGSLQRLEPDRPSAPPTRPVIPRQEDTFQIKRTKYTPSYVPKDNDPSSAASIKTTFETAKHDTVEAQQNVTYGLITRKRVEREHETETDKDANGKAPLHKTDSENELETLRRDLKSLPPEASLEAYEAVPVEAFGEALLRGMGWHEGRGLGRKGSGDVVPKETVRRPHRLGLGASAASAVGEQNKDQPAPPKLGTNDHSTWLIPNIRVKFIDKRAYYGSLYLRKGVIVKTKDPAACDVYFKDLDRVVCDINESMLETAVPSARGTPVLVVAGQYKGSAGRLLDRDSSRDAARVQLLSDMSIHTFALDDVAEAVVKSD